MRNYGLSENLGTAEPRKECPPFIPFERKQDKSAEGSRLKIALYSHDTMGLGHIRRNLLIAQALSSCLENPAILLISGAREATNFSLPEGADCITLPALVKNGNGNYGSRRLATSIDTLKKLRSKTICAAISAFEPDVFIVDNVARGAVGELDETLEQIQAEGKTRVVLGIRDIRDEASTVQAEWAKDKSEEIIRRYYDEIWVYGDKKVYNPVVEYGFSREIERKIRYTGYFDQKVRLNFTSAKERDTSFLNLPSPAHPFVLCTVGGGQDGEALANSFATASFPGETVGVLIAGPHMAPEKREFLKQQALKNPRLRVIEFVAEPTVLMQQAECVISMGGYNSVSEAISFRKKALIVPRIHPRKEQLIRAERLEELHILDMLHPKNLNAHALTDWMQKSVGADFCEDSTQIRLNGLASISQMVHGLATAQKGHHAFENQTAEWRF
ncbi:MAG: glycosyltransferase family protein [Nitrospinota bacterium]